MSYPLTIMRGKWFSGFWLRSTCTFGSSCFECWWKTVEKKVGVHWSAPMLSDRRCTLSSLKPREDFGCGGTLCNSKASFCATIFCAFALSFFDLQSIQIPSIGMHGILSLVFLWGTCSLSLSLSRHRPKNEIAKKFDVCRGFLDLRRQDGTPPTITCSVVDFDEGLDTQYCLQYFIYEI